MRHNPVWAARAALGLVVLAVVSMSTGAGAEANGRLPKVARLRAEVDSVAPADRYAALRRLMSEWDFGDPADVEEALREVAESQAQPAPVRAYASLLGAYARRRRGDVDGAKAEVAALGYVRSWMVVVPFDNEGKVGIDRAYEPDVDDAVPAPGKAYDGKERKVSWRASPAAAPFGWVDTGALVRPTEKVCVFAATWVRDPKLGKGQTRPLSIWAGAGGAMRLTFDGAVAIEDKAYRDFDPERQAASVTLRDGWARLQVKVCGEENAPVFTVRVADAQGGPAKGLEVRAQPPPGEVTARKAQPLPAQAVQGPLQALTAQAAKNDPARMEALARYMVDTQSDDPAEHKARDLANRAAKAAPTVKRALLAAELAEDRNQAGEWVGKAEALAAKGATPDEKLQVLLARAAHVRTGLTWREVVPLYDRALALDPDDTTAILAQADVYEEAGLKRTAIAAIQRALVRRPRSVALLRALSAALRQEERTTEADEVDERIALFRFDDGTFARARADLALARRDRVTAARWLERLIALDPDASDRLTAAAKVYAAFGDRQKAIALYKRALDLAPEDTDAMRLLADAFALGGQKTEQVALLKKVLELRPQSKDVREYLAHVEPASARPDEAYVRAPEEFLKLRDRPAGGYIQRTLVNLTVATVFRNGLASRFHQVVYQPLTDRAAVDGRTYAFSYESDSEVVQLRGARVYHKDGKVEDAVESGEGDADSPEIAMYTSARVFQVRFPRLSPGDVVELRYRIEDVAAHNAFADYFGDVEYLQSRDPIARAEYVLIGPKSRSFTFNTPKLVGGGAVAQTTEEKGDNRVTRFVATDVPAVDPEPNQPPFTEFFGHVHVSTYKTWDDVGKWYWGLVKDQFNADDEVRRRVLEVTKGLTDERAKVRAVYDYVVQKTRYVALEFGIHGFKPYSCAQIFGRGFGDCKDKATLIVTMLKELGIPATIVIVRTGLRGLFEESPASLAPFDHAIAYVPSLDLYLDGTAEYTGSTELPAMDRGAMALQINEGKPKLVHLPDPPASESKTVRKLDATLGEGGAAQVDWQADVTGVHASAWRQRYHAETSRKQRVQEDLADALPGLSVASVEAGKLDDVEVPVTLRAKAKVPDLARKEDANFSVPVGPREYLVREYASQSQRKQDLRLGARTTQVTEWTLRLPAGAKVSRMPKSAQGSSPFGSYEVQVDGSGGVVKVKTTIVIDRSRVSAAEYPALRAFCEAADGALGQRVVYAK